MSTADFLDGKSNSQYNTPFGGSSTTLVNPEDKVWKEGQCPNDVREIAERLQNAGLQHSRMGLFDYQPIGSTPVSRVSQA